MDSIDRYLDLLDLQTRIEVYCHLQAPFRMPHNTDEPGTAWFHLLLEGRCTIEVNGKKHELQAGDTLLFNGKNFIAAEAGADDTTVVITLVKE